MSHRGRAVASAQEQRERIERWVTYLDQLGGEDEATNWHTRVGHDAEDRSSKSKLPRWMSRVQWWLMKVLRSGPGRALGRLSALQRPKVDSECLCSEGDAQLSVRFGRGAKGACDTQSLQVGVAKEMSNRRTRGRRRVEVDLQFDKLTLISPP